MPAIITPPDFLADMNKDPPRPCVPRCGRLEGFPRDVPADQSIIDADIEPPARFGFIPAMVMIALIYFVPYMIGHTLRGGKSQRKHNEEAQRSKSATNASPAVAAARRCSTGDRVERNNGDGLRQPRHRFGFFGVVPR